MKKLNLNSFDFRTENQIFRITVSWDKDKFPNPDFSQQLNINLNPKNIIEVKAYELNNEQLKFAKKYHLPFKYTYYSLEDCRSFILLLEEYEELLIEAEGFGLYWDFSAFDFEGLKKAVSEAIKSYAQDYKTKYLEN